MFRSTYLRAMPWVSFAGFIGLVVLHSRPTSASPAVMTHPDTVFEGVYERRIADYPDGRAETLHVLTQPGTGVVLDVTPEQYPVLERGATIRVRGQRIDHEHFHVEAVKQVVPPPQMLIDPEKRDPRRIAFVMVEWGIPGGVAKEAAKVEMFTGSDSTNVFYQEVSYGMEKIVGNVFGPFEISEPTGCNMDSLGTQARNAMAAAGYDTEEFKQFMYFFPRYSECGWSGLASVGSPLSAARDSWYNGAFGCVVRAQEIGHNYGMGHSHSLSDCRDATDTLVPYEQNCADAYNDNDADEYSEYGDSYDPMGGGCAHINSVQKAYMGWIEGCNIVTGDSDGTFNLMAVELPCDGGQAIRFPMGDGDYYYLEYRRPLGTFDGPKGLVGVLVRVARGHSGSRRPSPHILDMNLNGPGSFLHAGDTYVDYQDRLTISVLEENDTHAVVQVTFPGGGSGADPVCDGGAIPLAETNGHWGTLACAESPFPVDDTPPEVSITYPADGDMFDPGVTLELTAEATDDNGVTEVELYLDGQPTFKKFEAPYSWSLTNIPEGTYQFGAVARDGPNWAPSEPITIYVGTEPPVATDTGSSSGTTTDGAGGTTTASTDSGTGTGSGSDSDSDGGTDTGGAATKDGTCACTQSGHPPGGALAFAGLVLGAAARRRRPTRDRTSG